LDGRLKTVTLAKFEAIKLSVPNARIAKRDGQEVVIVPTWNFETDETGEIVYLLDRSEKTAPKFKPGDELTHTKTGTKFNVVDPFRAFLKLRKGPKADE
jgi:hypothetical protein